MADHNSSHPNARPADLSEGQIDALADVGNRALNDHYHEDLCHCSDWPETCASSGNYFAGSWDTAAFSIGMEAVIGAWEAMRARDAADKAARQQEELRIRRNEDMALRGELSPSGGQREVPFQLGDSLLPAVKWLIARVAERGAQVSRLAEENEGLRERVAELEALEPATYQTCRTCKAAYRYGQPCSTCEFKAQMAAAAAELPETPRG